MIFKEFKELQKAGHDCEICLYMEQLRDDSWVGTGYVKMKKSLYEELKKTRKMQKPLYMKGRNKCYQ